MPASPEQRIHDMLRLSFISVWLLGAVVILWPAIMLALRRRFDEAVARASRTRNQFVVLHLILLLLIVVTAVVAK